ncbi:hypothetical protein IFM89_025107, partial [Coptis chinensis]
MGRPRGSASATRAEKTLDQSQYSNPSTKKLKLNSKVKAKANPRRSQRIRSSGSVGKVVSQCRDLEPVIVEASESKEAEHPDFSEETKPEEATGSTLEEKIEIIMLILDEQQKTLKEFLSKGRKRSFTQNSCMFNSESDMTNNCCDDQIDQLTKENLELRRKLEVSLGKLEGQEKVQVLFSDVIEKLKDTYLISSLAKTAEFMANFNGANAVCGCDPAAAKTK